jgi:hypothetical protein
LLTINCPDCIVRWVGKGTRAKVAAVCVPAGCACKPAGAVSALVQDRRSGNAAKVAAIFPRYMRKIAIRSGTPSAMRSTFPRVCCAWAANFKRQNGTTDGTSAIGVVRADLDRAYDQGRRLVRPIPSRASQNLCSQCDCSAFSRILGWNGRRPDYPEATLIGG